MKYIAFMSLSCLISLSMSCNRVYAVKITDNKVLNQKTVVGDKQQQKSLSSDNHVTGGHTQTETQRLVKDYKFNESINLLQREIKSKQKKKLPTESEKRDLKSAQIGQRMLAATQQIVFVDSVVTTYDNFLSKIILSKESGTIKPFNDFFNSDKQADTYLYVNELDNKCYYAMEDKEENLSLYTSDKLDGKWSGPSEIEIKGDQFDQMNYPYMMSDGTTLYFAATGAESLGGYDIFVTRYDSESGIFLKAENLGMPFNSPSNDYMYAEDELNNIGWFVTDRNQPVGKVCIYSFVPSETRQIYDSNSHNQEQIRQFARIWSISQTWGDGTERKQAVSRLNSIASSKMKKDKNDFNFVINDNLVYTSLSDFKSMTSKQGMTELLSKQKQLKNLQEVLKSLRNDYAKSSLSDKSEFNQPILQNEHQILALQKEIKLKEKFIRNTESQAIKK